MDYINEPIKKESKFLCRLQYIIIFLMIFISSSFFTTTLAGVVTVFCHYICVSILFIMSMLDGRKIIINSNVTLKLITLLMIVFMGAISSRGDESKQTIINIIQILVAYLYAMNFSFSDFLKKFSNVIYFLCWYSLIVYFLYIIIPDVVELLPDVYNNNGYKAENALFSTIYGGIRARNQSIFWEPGAFQTYINISLIIELFYLKNISKKRMIIYAVTIFTTYSTAGYIVAIFIVYTYVTQLLFSGQDNQKNSTRNLFFILTVILIAVVVFISLDNSVSEHVFGKLKYIQGSSGGRNTSASVRVGAITKPFKVFWTYPMFGAGTRGMTNFALNERYNMNTCTFVNWFAYFGVFFGAMMMRMFYKFAKRFSNNKFIVFMIFFSLFLMTATENYYRNPSILIFAFFPYLDEREENQNENITQYQQL